MKALKKERMSTMEPWIKYIAKLISICLAGAILGIILATVSLIGQARNRERFEELRQEMLTSETIIYPPEEPELTSTDELEEPDFNQLMEEEIQEAVLEDSQFGDDMLIARAVEAEAGGEPLVGKVAVAATLLNRSDSYHISIPEVIDVAYCPPAAFASEEAIEAVRIAREYRDLFPRNMMYFRTGTYHDFEHSEDYMIIGNHYFSLNDKYDRITGEPVE